MFFDLLENDESRDTNVLLYIRDVKFICRHAPFSQFEVSKVETNF